MTGRCLPGFAVPSDGGKDPPVCLWSGGSGPVMAGRPIILRMDLNEIPQCVQCTRREALSIVTDGAGPFWCCAGCLASDMRPAGIIEQIVSPAPVPA